MKKILGGLFFIGLSIAATVKLTQGIMEASDWWLLLTILGRLARVFAVVFAFIYGCCLLGLSWEERKQNMHKKELRERIESGPLRWENDLSKMVNKEDVLALVDQLDEPEKPKKVKIPKWYADAINWVDPMTKEPLPRAEIVTTIILNKNNYQMFNAKKQKWIDDNLETAIRAIWDGEFEIEDPLYLMPVPYLNNRWYIFRGGALEQTTSKEFASKFTAAEIDWRFPEIRALAEEVAE